MQIPFTGYADDCTVTGELGLETDRLSDFLAQTTEFAVSHAALRALDDGRRVEADSLPIFREDLCVVTASGPRGRVDRRLWTRQYPVRMKVGPYVIQGYLHAPPTIDPMHCVDRRSIVALTETILEYAAAGERVRTQADAVLVNCRRIDTVETATAAELGLGGHLEPDRTADPRAKDYTAAN